MSTVVGQVTPLSRHGDDFTRLEHLLQLSCRSTAVKDVNAWGISNPHLNVQYERRSQGLLAVDCWVDITTLDPVSNPIQEVCKRGFQMPDTGEGIVFHTGNITFDLDGPGACPLPSQPHPTSRTLPRGRGGGGEVLGDACCF